MTSHLSFRDGRGFHAAKTDKPVRQSKSFGDISIQEKFMSVDGLQMKISEDSAVCLKTGVIHHWKTTTSLFEIVNGSFLSLVVIPFRYVEIGECFCRREEGGRRYIKVVDGCSGKLNNKVGAICIEDDAELKGFGFSFHVGKFTEIDESELVIRYSEEFTEKR